MGKAIKWLRAMLGLKREKDSENSTSVIVGDKREKNRWSFSKSDKDLGTSRKSLPVAGCQISLLPKTGEEQSRHAIAVAAASAAAADAAVAAAQAAVAVVRLTNRGRAGLFNGGKEVFAAMKIQSVFRGYLARKALRALKGIVKLQALVRGYLVRKRAAATFHSMQALIRAQTTVRSQRARRRSHNKENNNKSSLTKPKKPISDLQFLIANDIENPRIVEMDTIKPRSRSRRYKNNHLSDSGEDGPVFYSTTASPANFEWCFLGGGECTPRILNGGWPGTPPAKSVSGEGYNSNSRQYSNYRNYMASTQSFKAKLRSRSAPKQRRETETETETEKEKEKDFWMKKRVALNEIMGPRNSMSSTVGMQPSCHRFGEEPFFDF